MNQQSNKPGYAALRRFRNSTAGADYFLTINLQARGSGVETETLRGALWNQGQRLQDEQFWQIRTSVIMPDHVHLLVSLGSAGGLADGMRLL
jgi:REP element-mobilizing transposase RayT